MKTSKKTDSRDIYLDEVVPFKEGKMRVVIYENNHGGKHDELSVDFEFPCEGEKYVIFKQVKVKYE